MDRVRCDEIGNCPLADGNIHEIDSIAGYRCALRDEVGRCGLHAEIIVGPEIPKSAKLAGIGAIVLLVVGVIGWFLIAPLITTPACKQEKVDSLRLAPQKGELERLGADCFKRAMRKGEIDSLGRSVLLLRLAADKGSAPGAKQLARLYDPLVRPDVEKSAAQPDILPPPDPALAARFYDIAAKAGDAEARDAVVALRQKYSLLAADGSQAARPDMLPVGIPGYPDVYQRIIAKPGATLAASPGGPTGQPLKPLDLLYVFERRPGWLRVGHSLKTGSEGWLAQDKAEDWQVMLAMRYAPPGGRRSVLFFQDDLAVASLLDKPGAASEIDGLIAGAQGGHPDSRLMAIEDRSVDWTNKPYVMPILKTRQVVTDSGATVNLAQVASVSGLAAGGNAVNTPALTGAPPAITPASFGAGPASPSYCMGGPGKSVVDVRHAITFVIDTTDSMGPYIEQAREVALSWRDELQRRGIIDKVSFGVVAYRNNMDLEPQRSQLEYVTKAALPLRPDASAAQLPGALAGLSAARVSTRTFDEDGVAGLREALDQDWSPFCGLRLIIYITDAGVLGAEDSRARYKGQGLNSIVAEARERQIRILPVHLETPAAHRFGDFDKAKALYQQTLGTSFSSTSNGYRSIVGGNPSSFNDYLDGLRRLSVPLANFGNLSDPNLAGPGSVTTASPAAGPPTIDRLLLGELFSIQQQFLGAAAGATAPTFAASWTSDRDLASPSRPALQVVVLLTRRQLNQLAEQTKRLITMARSAQLESARFFTLLRMTSAATAQDPSRFGDDASQMGSLLPSFLRLLPYRSDVLSLSEESWRAMGASRQDAFLTRLNEKISFYQKLDSNQNQWHKIDGNDRSEWLAEVPLEQLP